MWGDVILKPTVSNCKWWFRPGPPARSLLIAAFCTNMVSSNDGIRPKTQVLFYKPITCRVLHNSRYTFTAWADCWISCHLGRGSARRQNVTKSDSDFLFSSRKMVKYPILLVLHEGGSVIVMKERTAAPICIDNTWTQHGMFQCSK